MDKKQMLYQGVTMTALTRAKKSAITPSAPALTRAELALLYRKDGQDYWVRGYELFDPDVLHSTYRGRQPLKTKPLRPGCVFLMRRGQVGKPVQYEQSRIAIVQPGKHYFSFQEVFGSVRASSVTILDAVIESDDDDLSFGLTVPVVVEEEQA